jgi:hypothetical protein
MKNLLISFILGIVSAIIYESLAKIIGVNVFKKEALVVSGYKLHHSLYGVFFLLFSLVSKKYFFLGFGLGIIFQHTVTDGFLFVQKV